MDKKHPFGYGRIEYLGQLIIAAIVLYAGVTSLIESIKKIIHPETVSYTIVSFIILSSAIIVKLILGSYVKKKGQEVNSGSLIASGTDAMFDSILSISVLISAIIYLFTSVQLEAWVGTVISCIIIKSGVEIIRDAVDEIPDTMTANEIDLLTRRIQDRVFREHSVVLSALGIYAVHSGNSVSAEAFAKIRQIVMEEDGVLQMHGFSYDEEEKRIVFDIVIDFVVEDRNALSRKIKEKVNEQYPGYNVYIALDSDYSD